MKRAGWGLAIALVAACGGDAVDARSGFDAAALDGPTTASTLPPAPSDNPMTPAKIALGKRLFYDRALSRTREIACASCHDQTHAFADPRRVSVGVEGRLGTRNAPALVNLAWATSFFWDGGVDTLERQAMAPIMATNEMDLALDAAVARLAADEGYARDFGAAFGEPPSTAGLVRALATFVRSLASRRSRWDRFRAGDASALTVAEQRGQSVFFGEAGGCFHCHDGPDLTTGRYANDGTYVEGGDVGRQRVTLAPHDLGRFKIPTLRNVAVTAPYMHDGSLATLDEVVDHYARGGRGGPNTDANVHPLDLDEGQRADLVAFLRALTDEAFLTDPRFAP